LGSSALPELDSALPSSPLQSASAPDASAAPVGPADAEPKEPQVPAEASSPAAPPAPPDPVPNDKPPPAGPHTIAGKRSIEDLIRHVEGYEARLNALDSQLHTGAASPDTSLVQSCADSLRKANEEHLQTQSAVYQQFRQACEDRDGLRAVCDNVNAAVEAQKAEILLAAETIRGLQSAQQPAESCQQVVAQSARLLAAADRLRDRLHEALVEVVRSQPALPAGPERPPADSLTGILSRTGLEAELEALRQGDPQQARQVSLLMLDLDQFSLVNQRYGYEVGNRILRAVANVLAAEARTRCVAARFSGQRFAALVPDGDVRAATNLAERFRQTIEACRFQYQEFTIRVTVSCGAAGASPQDTSDALFARAANAVQEAKRYGRNRTFFQEGRYPSPVVPSSLTIQPRTIAL
jgi:diguanylate cyclase (GGDEF)-like protein